MKVDDYFTTRPCILCGSDDAPVRYPIDLEYAGRHADLDLRGQEIGVARCRGCGHLFVQPMPETAFLARFYESYMSRAKQTYYRQQSQEEIPAAFRRYYWRWLKRVLKRLPGHEPRRWRRWRRQPVEEGAREKPRLLDVGCGVGMFLRLAREAGFEVAGVEPNPEAAAKLREQHGIDVHNCLIEQLEIPADQRYDVATMWDLLEHLADPEPSLRKVHAALEPGGLLVIEVPVRDSFTHGLVRTLYSATGGLIRKPLLSVYGIHHLHYYSTAALTAYLARFGFDVTLGRRSETNLRAKRKRGGLGAQLYNAAMYAAFAVGRLTRHQNKFILIARKVSSGQGGP